MCRNGRSERKGGGKERKYTILAAEDSGDANMMKHSALAASPAHAHTHIHTHTHDIYRDASRCIEIYVEIFRDI